MEEDVILDDEVVHEVVWFFGEYWTRELNVQCLAELVDAA
jgi:hypothetical protein